MILKLLGFQIEITKILKPDPETARRQEEFIKKQLELIEKLYGSSINKPL